MIDVLIADDHPVVRRGLKQIVTEEPDMSVRGEAASAPEVLQQLRSADWDVLVLDLNMPGMGGLELLREVKRLRPRLPVLVLSVHPAEQVGVRVIRAGALGYLTKDSADDELVEAIRTAVSGGTVIGSALGELLADSVRAGTEAPSHAALSDREYEVLRLIGEGATVSEIAEQLELSVKTISTYRTRVLEKLGLETTAQLMRYAMRAGLVQGTEPVAPV